MIKLKDYKFFLFTGPTNIKFEAIDVNISITIRQMDSIVGHLTIQKKTQKYT